MVFLDSMLLVLLVVGDTSREYVERHKRLAAYTEDDYDVLLDLLKQQDRIAVTPNCLTEASNLLRQIADPMRTEISRTFRGIVDGALEAYAESRRVVRLPQFLRLGLADTALLEAAREPATLLTADARLYLAALGAGLRAENFNHHRLGGARR